MAKDVHHERVVHVYASMMRCHEKYVFHIIVEVLIRENTRYLPVVLFLKKIPYASPKIKGELFFFNF